MICVECVSQGRPATVEWVEQMDGKHQSLPTSKLVLVSKSGFTTSAKKCAAKRNIDTVELVKAERVDWTKIVKKEKQLLLQLVDAVTVTPVVIYRDSDAKYQQAEVSGQDVLYTNSGSPISIGAILNHLLPSIRTTILDNTTHPGIKDFWFDREFEEPLPTFRLSQSIEVRVEKLRAGIMTTSKKEEMPLESGTFREQPVAIGSVQLPDRQVLVAVLEQPNKPLSIGMVQVPKKVSTKKKRRSRNRRAGRGHQPIL